jgi:hypothetical protein
VYAGKNVVGSGGPAAAVVAVVTQGMSLREIPKSLRPALLAEALRSGMSAPGSLAVLVLREAQLKPKQDGVSESAGSERNTNSKALESTSPNATEAPDPWSGEPRPRPPLSPRRFPPRPLPPANATHPWHMRPLTSQYAKMPNYRGAVSEAQGEELQSARRAARYRGGAVKSLFILPTHDGVFKTNDGDAMIVTAQCLKDKTECPLEDPGK